MEQKNDAKEKTESTQQKSEGLKLVGVDTDAMREKAQASVQEVWDFSEGDETQWLTTAKSAIIRETEENRFTDVGSIILIISQIISYICVVAEIVCLAYITTLEPTSIIENIAKYKAVFLVCSAGLIIDAIVVNIIMETKLSLIVVAWLFPFLYPGMRQMHVKGNFGIGVWVSIFYFLSFCGFFAFVGKQALYYGKVLTLEDKNVKAVAIDFLDQPVENGETMGELFKEHFSIDEVTAYKKDKKIYMTFTGNGLIYYSSDTLIRGVSKNIPTTLVFVSDDSGAKYKLCDVTVKDIELTEIGIGDYWKEMIK